MSLANWQEKFKSQSLTVAVSLITILGFTFGFGLGRLSKIEEGRSPIKIEQATATDTSSHQISATGSKPLELSKTTGGKLVASRNGKKYYLPWCGGVDRIKPENLISFASAAEARARGYTPAANCPGLE